MKKPIIGITMGDPSGVGPEIIVKSLNNEELYNRSHPIVIGDSKRVLEVIKILNLNLEVKSISENADFETTKFGEIKCLDLNLLPDNIEFGQINLTSGDAAFKYLSKAINLANSKRLDAICTAPLNKEAMQKAGHLYPGHTEILADLTNTDNYAMMLSSPKLKVIHVTTHVGLIEAINQIKPERVFDVIKMADVTLKIAVLKILKLECVALIHMQVKMDCSEMVKKKKN